MSRLSLRHFLRNEAEDIPINFARAPRKVQDRSAEQVVGCYAGIIRSQRCSLPPLSVF